MICGKYFFLFLKIIKSWRRTALDVLTMDALIRIAVCNVEVETFDPEPPTEIFKKEHKLCD